MLQSQPGETGSRQSFPKESGMTTAPLEITVGLSPRARYDAIDVSERVRREHGALLADFPRILYCSHHTTAGYLDQAFARRLLDRGRGIDPFVEAFQTLFPEQAGYQHDELDRRIELTEEERRREPPNADAHLTFIGSGLSSCATYLNDDASPVFFVGASKEGAHGMAVQPGHGRDPGEAGICPLFPQQFNRCKNKRLIGPLGELVGSYPLSEEEGGY